jgi:hypothetical protein
METRRHKVSPKLVKEVQRSVQKKKLHATGRRMLQEPVSESRHIEPTAFHL